MKYPKYNLEQVHKSVSSSPPGRLTPTRVPGRPGRIDCHLLTPGDSGIVFTFLKDFQVAYQYAEAHWASPSPVAFKKASDCF